MSNGTVSSLAAMVERMNRSAIVQRETVCPRTGETLDVNDSVFILNNRGVAFMALSQRGWQEILANQKMLDFLAKRGMSVDSTTVK